MKKIISIILLFSFCFLLTGCPPSDSNIPYAYIDDFEVTKLDISNILYYDDSELEITSEEYDKYIDGYDISKIEGICINSVDELVQIHNNDDALIKYFNKYNENFFKNGTLVLIPFITDNTYYEYKYLNRFNTIITRNKLDLYDDYEVEEGKYIALYTISYYLEKADPVTTFKCSMYTKENCKISIDSSKLTNRFLNNVKYEPYNEFNDEKLTVAQIENMSLEERKSTIRQIYFKQQDKNSESSYRKQTCAYIHKDVIKLIDSIDNVNGEDIYSFLRYYSSKNATLIGINYYLLKFNIYYNSQNDPNFKDKKISDDDVIWYEFYSHPKDEIPKEIGDYILACVLDKDTIIVKDLDDNIIEESFMYRESYVDSKIENVYNNALLNIGYNEQSSYITYCGNDNNFEDEFYFMPELYSLLYRKSFVSYSAKNDLEYYVIIDEIVKWKNNNMQHYIIPKMATIEYKFDNGGYYNVTIRYYRIRNIVLMIKDEIL